MALTCLTAPPDRPKRKRVNHGGTEEPTKVGAQQRQRCCPPKRVQRDFVYPKKQGKTGRLFAYEYEPSPGWTVAKHFEWFTEEYEKVYELVKGQATKAMAPEAWAADLSGAVNELRARFICVQRAIRDRLQHRTKTACAAGYLGLLNDASVQGQIPSQKVLSRMHADLKRLGGNPSELPTFSVRVPETISKQDFASDPIYRDLRWFAKHGKDKALPAKMRKRIARTTLPSARKNRLGRWEVSADDAIAAFPEIKEPVIAAIASELPDHK